MMPPPAPFPDAFGRRATRAPSSDTACSSHAPTTSGTVSSSQPRMPRLGVISASSRANGSVAANSTYSRIGAPKKNPMAIQSGGSGETRWKSMMPDSRTPPTDPLICAAPMNASKMACTPSRNVKAAPLAMRFQACPAQMTPKQTISTTLSHIISGCRRSRVRACFVRIGLSRRMSTVITTAPSPRS
jgi:hypothetical protein